MEEDERDLSSIQSELDEVLLQVFLLMERYHFYEKILEEKLRSVSQSVSFVFRFLSTDFSPHRAFGLFHKQEEIWESIHFGRSIMTWE